jgi:UDP-glucose 4-epimerase
MTSLAGMNVLVTGADGFIGSHLAEQLARAGARVRAFCFYNSLGSHGWLDDLDAECRAGIATSLGDIRDARLVASACEGMDVVFHLAALVAIPYSYQAPESFIDTNVRGTLNVLEGARRAGVRRLVQISTSEVYGTPATVPIRETHGLRAQSPYAASKIGADQLALAYHDSYAVPVTILRPFNTYGPRQSTRAVLPTILIQLLAGRTEIELGRLDPRRDLTFVLDTVDGMIRAGTVAGVEGKTIQLGTGRSLSVKEIFEAACRTTGVQALVRENPRLVRSEASEVWVLEADPRRAREELGWTPRVSFEEGLAITADWFRENLARYPNGIRYV